MAKLHDKFFNRVIEGELADLSAKDAEEIGKVVKGGTKLYLHKGFIQVKNDKNETAQFHYNILTTSPTKFTASLSSGRAIIDWKETPLTGCGGYVNGSPQTLNTISYIGSSILPLSITGTMWGNNLFAFQSSDIYNYLGSKMYDTFGAFTNLIISDSVTPL